MNVHCTIAQCPIPESVCLKEQGRHCRGCIASTRRCLTCHKPNAISDSTLGLCESCLPVVDSDETIGLDRIEACIASAMQRVQKSPLLLSVPKGPLGRQWSSKPETPKEPPLSEADIAFYFKLLLEHAQPQEDGSSIILEPIRTLEARLDGNRTARFNGHPIHLSASQCRSVIEITKNVHGLQLHEMGDRCVLVIPKDCEIPEAAETSPHAPKTVSDVAPRAVPKPPAVTTPKKPSDAQILTLLAEEAVLIGGERIVRGAIPLVQTRLMVGARFARETLERFEQQAYVLSKSGFACIALTEKPIPEECGTETYEPLESLPKRAAEEDERIEHLRDHLSRLEEKTVERKLERLQALLGLVAERSSDIEKIQRTILTTIALIEAGQEASQTIQEIQDETRRVLATCTDAIEQLFQSLR